MKNLLAKLSVVVLIILGPKCVVSQTPDMFSFEYRRSIPFEEVLPLFERQRTRIFGLEEFSLSPDPSRKDGIQFFSTWQKAPKAAQRFIHGVSLEKFDSFVKDLPSSYFPVDIAVVSIGGDPLFTGLWMNDSDVKWKYVSKATAAELREINGKLKGLWLADVTGYVMNGQVYYSAFWKDGEDVTSQIFHYGATYREVMDAISNRGKGMIVHSLTSFTVDGETRYCLGLIEIKEKASQRFAISLPKNEFERKFDQYIDDGYIATNLSADVEKGVIRYSGVFNKDESEETATGR